MKDFRRILAGQSLDELGTGFTVVALPLLVLHITHSAAWLGVTAGSLSAGAAVGGLVGAAIADAVSRRTLLVSSAAAQCVLTAVMPLSLLWAGSRGGAMTLVVACSALLGVVGAAFYTSFSTLMPRVVDASEIPRANALVFTVQNAALLVGPALAGILIGVAGLTPAFEVDAATFLVSLLSILGLSVWPAAGSWGRWRHFSDGFATVWRTAEVRALLALGFFAYLGTGAVIALLIYRLSDELGAGPTTVGVVISAVSAGGFVGSAAAAHFSTRGLMRSSGQLTEGRVALAAVAGAGVLLVAMTSVNSPLGFAALGAGAEACGWIGGIAALSLTQRLVPELVLGRVMSIAFSVSWTGALLGQVTLGTLVGWHGAAMAFAVYGAEMIAAAVMLVFSPLSTRSPASTTAAASMATAADPSVGH